MERSIVRRGCREGDRAQGAPRHGPRRSLTRVVVGAMIFVGLVIAEAVRAWHDAYVTALGSRRWEGMVEVGDAYLRIGDLSGFRKESEAKARRIYMSALFQARAQGSLDGVLRVADAFLVLGDREVVYQCLRIAESLADRGRDASARARVRAFEARLRGSFPGVESPEFIGQVFPP
jgi:hypothetical protein